MVFPIYPEMIPNHDAFRSPTPPLPGIFPHAQTGLTGPIFPGNDTEKLQKILLSVRDGEMNNFYAENEQKAQAGMAVILKPPKPYDIQFALPEMCSQLQTEFPGCGVGLPALSVQSGASLHRCFFVPSCGIAGQAILWFDRKGKSIKHASVYTLALLAI